MSGPWAFNTRAAADSICGVLFIRHHPGTFHWGIVIPSNDSDDAELFHVLDHSGSWSFERKTHKVYQSGKTCVIVKLGTLTATNTVDRIAHLLERIPLSTPTIDRAEPMFTCRVWFKQAIRVLAANGIVTCPDVSALERDMADQGRMQDLSTAIGRGFIYHVPPSSIIH